MSENTEITNVVAQASTEVDGTKTLPCAKALGIAADLGVDPVQIGQNCNQQKIKITGCQLGCFK